MLISIVVLFQFFHTFLVLNNLERSSEVNKWQDALSEDLSVTLIVSQLENSSDNCLFFLFLNLKKASSQL